MQLVTPSAEHGWGIERLSEGVGTVILGVILLGNTTGYIGWEMHPVLVNGVPGRLARDGEGNAVAVLTLDVADGLVKAVRIVVNPDKLAHLQAP